MQVSEAAGALVPAGAAGVAIREGFEGTSIERTAETSATALAERERATIQAMFFMAMQRRRSVARFEDSILKECERPGFAEIARYRKPVGKKKNDAGEWEQQYAEGWSVRFAEGVIRYWGNLFIDSKSAFENDQQRIVRNVIIDLESNVTISTELNLGKAVERRGFKKKHGKDDVYVPPEGREVIGERLNTYGEKVFKVAATDEELNMKQSAHFSKFIRNVTRLVPGDILDRCLEQVDKTLGGETLEARIQKMVVRFDALKVKASDLQAFTGKSLSALTAADVDNLRGIYTAIKDGETNWSEVMATVQPEAGSADAAKEVAERRIAEEKAKVEAHQAAASTADPLAETKPEQADNPEPDASVQKPVSGLFPNAFARKGAPKK